MNESKKQPTMSDVARLAGVSAMTVSRALRQGTSASDATRKKILDAAEKLGYVPDSTAAGLSSGKTGFVAATIPSINNANFADTVRGLTDGLAALDLQILLGYTDYDPAEEERLVEQFLRRRPEAVVVTGGSHTERCRRLLGNIDVPVIETWDIPADPIGDVIGFSNAESGRIMVRHFHEQGYRRIGFIGGDTSRDSRGLDRRRGFVAALEEFGLPSDRLVASGPPPITMREGAKAMLELLKKWPDTDAVMCVSDLSAFGAMTACQREGLRVPDDIAIAGFGAYDLAEHAIPSITTIDVGAYQIGRQAAAVIAARLERSDMVHTATSENIAPQLLARASTLRTRSLHG